jgi:uncharacterized protein (TIGR02118 family)
MIRVTVSYPNQPGSRFDLDYYLAKHMAMVDEKLGPHGLKSWSVEKGLSGGAPGSPARNQIRVHLTFETLEGMQAGMAAEGRGVMADIPNFTDVRPDVQIYQVLK